MQGLLSVSEYSANLLPQFGSRRRVIGAGVDIERFRPPEPGARRDREIVFVGRILPHKGIHMLIRAIDEDMRLHIYGRQYDRHYRDWLGSLARDKAVFFHESAADEEIVAAYQRARVAVLPSLDRNDAGQPLIKSELFGIALAEAMACGTPAVCSRVGGMPEVVVDGVTGLVVPARALEELREALRTICDASESRWREMSVAARQQACARWAWERVSERTLEAYDELGRLGPAR